MTVVAELIDALKMIADVVRNTREIIKAVNDGRAFLATRHPEAQGDFAALLDQMEITVIGLTEVTQLISSFRFTVAEDAAASEMARFNAYVVEQEKKVSALKGNIRRLKGSSGKIQTLANSLAAMGSEPRDWSSMFGLLGVKKRERAAELAYALGNFYAVDQKVIDAIRKMLGVAEKALADVNSALGPRGTAYPENLAAAGLTLGFYAGAFQEPGRELQVLADEMHEVTQSLAPV